MAQSSPDLACLSSMSYLVDSTNCSESCTWGTSNSMFESFKEPDVVPLFSSK